MKICGDELRFFTGYTGYANRGIVGLVKERGGWAVYEGYDGMIWDQSFDHTEYDLRDITPTERIELAEYMIKLWGRFKKDAKKEMLT